MSRSKRNGTNHNESSEFPFLLALKNCIQIGCGKQANSIVRSRNWSSYGFRSLQNAFSIKNPLHIVACAPGHEPSDCEFAALLLRWTHVEMSGVSAAIDIIAAPKILRRNEKYEKIITFVNASPMQL